MCLSVSVLAFELVLTLGVYYIIILYYYIILLYIILYIILYSYLLLFSPIPSPSIFFPILFFSSLPFIHLSPLPHLLFFSFPSLPIFISSIFCSSLLFPNLSSSSFLPISSSSPNHSIRVGSYIYLFILSLPISSDSFFPIFQSSSVLLLFLPLPPNILFPSSPPILPSPHLNPPHFILYVSRVSYSYLYSGGDSQDDILTPHVLSEWMVEV